MQTQAAVLHSPQTPFQIETLDLADPRPGEVLVKMAAAGVCHSDWHLATGASQHPLPVVPGHEGAGLVAAVGAGVTRVNPGDRVALNWSPNCGDCFYCQRGLPYLCSAYVDKIWAGTLLDGETRLSRNGSPVYHFSALACFAEHTVVPQECCVPMPADTPWEVAALIGCAVTTGVGAVLNTARVAEGDSVAIFGAGGVGLSAVFGASYAGAERIVVVDPSPARRKIALQLGATHSLPSGPDSAKAVRDLTEGRGADYVIEAVGAPAVQEQCLEAARPGGVIVLAGLAPMGSSTNLPGAVITRQEKTVKGCYYGSADTARDFPLYAQLRGEGKLPIDRLITRTYPLREINQAFAEMLAGHGARGLIVFEQ